MRIGEAAEHVGVAVHVLRHWEELGILSPARTGTGHRTYREEDVRLACIAVRCRAVGMALPEIAELLRAHDGDRASLVERHRERIARQRDELAEVDAYLGHVLACTDPALSTCPHCARFSGAQRGPGDVPGSGPGTLPDAAVAAGVIPPGAKRCAECPSTRGSG